MKNCSLIILCLCFLSAATITQAKTSKNVFQIVLGLPHQNKDVFEQKFWRISTPNTKEYLKHLSITEIKQIIGASKGTVKKAKDFILKTLKCIPNTIQISSLHDMVTAQCNNMNTSDQNIWSKNGLPLKKVYNQQYDFILRRDEKREKFKDTYKKNDKKNSHNLKGSYSIGNQKKAYGIPVDLVATNETLLQMVWGPGTFGYSKSQLEELKKSQVPLLNLSKVKFDTDNHGTPGGDNWGEGNLDVSMITSFGLNVETLVSNTNTSSSTEEGNGFGQALLDFVTELSSRKRIPQILSISLGSLSAYSCDLLCKKAAEKGFELSKCNNFLQDQRQVCMFLSQDQVKRINAGFQILGARGTTIFGSSGDGGSHFSFEPFSGGSELANTLNDISCEYNMPVFPTTSPYVTSVGGTDWGGFFPSPTNKPEAWSGSGGGFSWQFERPEYQIETIDKYIQKMNATSAFPPSTSYNNVGRGYPDIAAVSIDGTSQSSPTMAGIWSMITDHRLNKGLPPLGHLGPRLYQVNEKYPGEAFFDILKGNTKTSCDTGFGCTNGWDPVTGFGRPIFNGMLKHFGNDD
eukprot:g2328.t1